MLLVVVLEGHLSAFVVLEGGAGVLIEVNLVHPVVLVVVSNQSKEENEDEEVKGSLSYLVSTTAPNRAFLIWAWQSGLFILRISSI